ncbi:MAG: protein kinase [bacterium]|nr:protein kinase [bacterium]
MSDDVKDELIGASIDGGAYTILSELGAGGMGAVYIAASSRLNTEVVIKFPHAVMMADKTFATRFETEISSLISLSHHHQSIVTILDVGKHLGRPYAVMQYLTGGSLVEWRQKYFRDQPPTKNWRKALRWVERIADALDFVHARDIIHRDVKPQNILFDGGGTASLADFGIAKVVSQNTTRQVTGVNQVVGTMGYMAGELLTGDTIDGRVDQFALGVTLYEMMTGKRPFEADNPHRLYMNQQAGEFTDLHVLCPSVPEELSHVVRKAISHDPDARFESCGDFASAVLDTFITTTVAVPVGPAEKSDPPPVNPPAEPKPSGNSGDGRPKPEAERETSTGNVSDTSTSPKRLPPPRPSQAQPKQPTPPNIKPAAGASSAARDVTMPPMAALNPPPKPLMPPVRPPKERANKPPNPPIKGKPSPGSSPFRTPPASGSPFRTPAAASPPGQSNAPPAKPVPAGQPSSKAHSSTCPWCWSVFRDSEVLWVAEHQSLIGDPVLGPDEFQRFLPDRFTGNGRAIDLMGSVCHRTACPRCHLVVPQELVEFEPIFVSVVGTPSSGKTCFLTSMSWQLRRNLPKEFLFSFTDADPELNHRIIQNEQMNFMNNSDRLVRLAKTEVQGEAYRTVTINGRETQYVQPTLFSLTPSQQHPNAACADQISFALCMYDNAGEHFLPGKDDSNNPVTRHLAKSEAIIFLFDPSQHPGFRRKVQGSTSDPQFQEGFYANNVRQETVLTEALQRIRRYGSLSLREKYPGPVIIVVNKYDAWASRFGSKRLENPWRRVPGQPAEFDNVRIEKVSEKIRGLMETHCSEVVAAADNFSDDVLFVPISSFGRRVVIDPTNGDAGVPPSDLNPMWADVPMLSILSRIRRGVIPRRR